MQTTWNLELLFKNEAEIKKYCEESKKHTLTFVKKWSERDDYLKDPKVLKEALDEYSKWLIDWGPSAKAAYYYGLKQVLDQNNPEIKANYNKIQEFAIQLENEIQFFLIRIAKIDIKLHKTFLSAKELTAYKHFLERVFAEADHVLTEPEEKILNTLSPLTSGNWVRMLSGFLSKEEREVLDEDGKKTVKNFSELLGLMNSSKKKVRDKAAEAFNDILNSQLDVAENEFNAVLQNKQISDTLRNYQRPDAARHLSDDIDTEVVDALIDSVSKKFEIAKKYYTLKAKLSGVKKLKYHERNVPYGNLDKKYTYQEAYDLVLHVFSKLDKEFAMIFTTFHEQGQVDVYPRKGKGGGAFCAHNRISDPTYILLNYNNEINDVQTIAHEMGHGINNELMRAKQNALTFGVPMSTAEVASTFMEDFVLDELLKEADDEVRLSLMVSKLNEDISTIFRQIAFYNFETEIHSTFRQKGYLSKEEIGSIFQKHMVSYMGNAVEQSDGAENWWVYVSHFRSFFYVYSYSSGLLISKSLQAQVKKDPTFIVKVKEFLSAGSSDSPKNIFAKLGIDITKKSFWDNGIKEVEELLEETEKLAKKLKKI